MKRDNSIFIKNIYYMLSYAFTALKGSVYEDVRTEAFDNIWNLFAAILSKGIGLQLKQGLYREYLNRVEDCGSGKSIYREPSGTAEAAGGCDTCDYDELVRKQSAEPDSEIDSFPAPETHGCGGQQNWKRRCSIFRGVRIQI